MNRSGFSLPLVIPVFEPEDELLVLLDNLSNAGIKHIILVDDGSGKKYRGIFDKAERKGYTVLRHAANLGKGRALKTAFNFILCEYAEAIGVVTTDSDGQHTLKDIIACIEEFYMHPDEMILGSRKFTTGENVPWKSRFGNEITKISLRLLCGISVADSQTGLRIIPREFMKRILNTPGERFEYETNVLLESKGSVVIREIEIEAVYDSRDNHQTHFDPLRDSLLIYHTILSYSLSSLFSAMIDFALFALVNGALGGGIWLSTAIARTFSSLLNFFLNHSKVFKARGNVKEQLIQYIGLVIVSGTVSSFLINAIWNYTGLNTIIIKAIVETLLFFFNFYIQNTIIFVKTNERG